MTSNVQINIDLVTRQAQASASDFSESLRGVGASVAIAEAALELMRSAINALIQAMTQAISSAVTFAASLAEIASIAPDIDLSRTKKQLLDLSSSFGLSLQDVTKGMYDLISAGISVEDSTKAVSAAAKLAIGGVTDQTTAISALTNIMNAWGLKGIELNNITDSLFITVKNGKLTMSEYANAIGNVSATAAGVGIPMNQVNAAIAALTLGGKSASEASNDLKQAISNLAKPTKELEVAYKRATGETIEATLKSGDFEKILQGLQKTAGGNNQELLKMFSSIEGGSAIVSLTGKQFGSFKQTLVEQAAATQHAGKVTDEAFSKMADTASFQMSKLKNSLSNLSTEMLVAFEPAIAAAIRILNGFISTIRDFVRNNEATFLKAGEAVLNFVKDVGKIISAIQKTDEFQYAIQTMKEIVVATFSILSQSFERVKILFMTLFEGMIDSPNNVTLSIINMKNVVLFVIQAVVYWIELLATTAIYSFGSVVTGIELGVKFFLHLRDKVYDTISDIIKKLSQFLDYVSITFSTLNKIAGIDTFSEVANGAKLYSTALDMVSKSSTSTAMREKELNEVLKMKEKQELAAKNATIIATEERKYNTKIQVEAVDPINKTSKSLSEQAEKEKEAAKAAKEYAHKLKDLEKAVQTLQYQGQNLNKAYKLIDTNKEFKAIADVLGAEKVAISIVESERLKASGKSKEAELVSAKLIADYKIEAVKKEHKAKEELQKNVEKMVEDFQQRTLKAEEELDNQRKKKIEEVEEMKARFEQETIKAEEAQIQETAKKRQQQIELFISSLSAAAATVKDLFTSALSGIGQILSGDILGGIENSLEAITKIFGDTFSGATGIFLSAFKIGLNGAISSFETGFKAVSGGFVADFANGMNNYLDSFKVTFDAISKGTAGLEGFNIGIFGDIGIAVEKFASTFEQKIPTIIDAFVKDTPKIVQSISKSIPKIIDTLIKNFPKVLKSIVEGIPSIFQAIINSIPLITSTIIESLPMIFDSLIQLIPQLVGSLLDSLIQLMPVVLPAVINIITAVILEIINKLPQILDELLRIVPLIIEKIPIIVEALSNKLPAIIDVIVANLPKIIEAIIKAIPQIIEAVIKSLPSVVVAIIKNLPEIVKALIEQMATQFLEQINIFKRLGTWMFDGLSESIKDAWNWFKVTGNKIWQGLWDKIIEFWSYFATIGQSIWQGLWDKVLWAWDYFKDIGKQIWSGLWNSIVDSWNWFGSIGQKIWEGFSSGLSSIGSGASGIIDSVTEAIGLARGGIVQGVARVPGDSARNDRIPAMLSAGEMVIPRSVMDEGILGVLAFARDAMGLGRSGGSIGMASGGFVSPQPSGGSITDEIRALREEIHSMRFESAKLQTLSYKIISRWDVDGLPETRVV